MFRRHVHSAGFTPEDGHVIYRDGDVVNDLDGASSVNGRPKPGARPLALRRRSWRRRALLAAAIAFCAVAPGGLAIALAWGFWQRRAR